ncbi:alpha/beta hydrolase family protein [Flavobacterium taihuense]|uniref:Proline iminopeptidase n=1 Tax=Flavobacterium taihuense TaxID=2857508 RepID=A0ABS6XU20_9FLAO|nr:alpha/beta hydrolase [Flavobacterium taihuense]MBW4359857.1 alpha/beta hydrolase [Flavobacterium taihuense]
MKNLSCSLNLILFPLLLSASLFAKSPVRTGIVKISNDSIITKQISEDNFVLINGIDQWITIKGESSKPIILFIHGGPGSPISPYSDKLYKDLTKDFIIVQWDQRGTGKTYGRNAPVEFTPEFLQANPLTIEQMTDDGIAVSEYLLKHLGKQKLILFGTSWGSALGVKIVTKRPDLFYAYVGHSQIVKPAIDDAFYNKIYKIAKDKNDTESLEVLNSIGKPPYDRAKKTGQLFRVLKKYERANSTPAPETWFVEAPAYNSSKDIQNREEGDDYSFVNYIGDSKLRLHSIIDTIDLMKDNLEFKIPVYLIQGNEDLMTPKEASKAYFDKIKAPEKKYYLLPKAAHGFNEAVLEAQIKIFRSIKTL